tara:strand:- start:296 stop:478 length:183 start_codon:yes stop_codon:yes gene_type:complete
MGQLSHQHGDLVVAVELVVLVVMDHLLLVVLVVLVLDYPQLSAIQEQQVHHLHGLVLVIK